MGRLLERVAAQQTLLEAWAEVRRRAEEGSQLAEEIRAFEKRAAERLAEISRALLDGSWRPSPVIPAAIPKPDGGRRRLGISVLEDRIVERAILEVLDPIVDPHLMPWSFAYRKGLGVADAIAALVEERDKGCDRVVRGDVSECFDSVPRARLLDRLRPLVADSALVEVIRLLLYRPRFGEEESSPTGLHQGSVLSPLFANVYLDAFDRAMAERGWKVIRYADDFAVAVRGAGEAETVMREAQRCLAALGLQLSEGKCTVREFEEGVPFLGSLVTATSGARSRSGSSPQRTTLYVANEGGLLRSKGNRIRLERDGETVLSVGFNRVRQIVVFGRTGFTTPLLQALLERGIDVVFLGERGRYFGRLQAATSANPATRLAQFRVFEDEEARLALARRFVRGKIANMRSSVLRGARRLDAESLQEVVRGLESDRQAAAEAKNLPVLLGVEGTASRRYFGAFGSLLAEGWEFEARRRRPPPDPVNALLSLGYTLLLHDAMTACETVGLDPYVGFLHEPQTGRPSLALDLIEEFRPLIVDSVVLRCVNSGSLSREHFDMDPGPPQSCTLTPDGLRRFLSAYERRMLTLFTHSLSGRRVSYRVGLILQARHLAEVCSKRTLEYTPVLWK
ncbi:MAG: hypothetical protein KatS3mg008_1305 [Acidimicrobiales bacterium]|nr:MAG: hypothetical protein KatS3mg008_1305 [Acidimicrobiales bacterium]